MTNGKSRQFASLELLLVILAAGALTGCATPLGPPPPGAKTRVYVADITQNNVLAYIINDFLTGALTAMAGSPFASFLATGLKVHPSGKYIYVSDEANGIRAFSINGMGALAEIAGSPFAAGNEPFGVSVDLGGRFLYTANFVSNDVSGFSIDTNTGKLSPVPGSPFAVGVTPARAVVDTLGLYLYVPDSFDNTVRAYSIGLNGALTAVSGSPFAATGAKDVMTIP